MSIKIGSFRVLYKNGLETYIPYTEFYDRGKEYREQMKASLDKGEITLFCGCNKCNELPLTITQNLVIRVANNKGQANHLDSCPKSEVYETWAAEHKAGLLEIDEDGKLCFNITVPSGQPSKGGSSSSSSSESSGIKQRANTVDLVTSVCYYAWTKQGYSIKKNIKTCRAEGRKPDWDYKNFEDFNRLFFGVTADIDVYWQQSYHKLKDLCYRSDVFFQSDYQNKYLIYARIDKLSEWKEERKYQYITLCMRGSKSANKATVRILTEKITKDDFEALNQLVEGKERYFMLTGYARHDMFEDTKTKEVQHWITMLNFAVVETAKNGLVLRHPFEREIIDTLCQRRLLFKKTLLPLANYGEFVPTAIIEQANGRDILIDITATGQEFNKRELLIKDNPEFEILLYKKKTDVNQIIDDIFRIFSERKKEENSR